MLSLVPVQYRLMARVVVWLVFTGLVCFAAYWLYSKGRAAERVVWEAREAKLNVELAEYKAASGQVTVREVVKYVDRVQVVRQRSAAIVKEVPVYVSKDSDAGCVVPSGFVRLHDAAAADVVPDAPGPADGAASGVALSAVAETVTSNYGLCHEVRERLIGLQGWVRGQQELAKGGGDGLPN